MPKKNGFNGDSVKIFVSYSSTDKEVAGRLKNELENLGLEVFLAHEDIPPSQNWEKHLEKYLTACDVFMPLLTKEFIVSEYCDQETGIAIKSNKKIIPIKIDIDPYGFVKKIQALKMDKENIRASAIKIMKTIQDDSSFKQKMLNCFIKQFCESWSFADAGDRAEILEEYNEFSEEQINLLAKGGVENRQIYESHGAKPILKKIFLKNMKKIKPDYSKKVKAIFNL